MESTTKTPAYQPIDERVTTSNGAPIPIHGLTSSMTAGERGPIALQDYYLLEHLSHFNRERIPERVVHAKGAGAFGVFTVTSNEISHYCHADLFSEIGKETRVAVRFSTGNGECGSADTLRDTRGFAIKFYTSQGNWDLVGNNTPVFFIRDPILFPGLVHAQKRNPKTHLKDPNMFWDFMSLRPETIHQVTILYSDRGIPDGYRYMHGYGCNTYKNINSEGVGFYVKYHLRTNQGIRNLSVEKANELAGSNPDYATQDLFQAITRGEYPSWTLYIQVMTMQQADVCAFNPFDVTKTWLHRDYPLIEVGRLVLNQNPGDYFTQVEQLSFSPSHMVPGIEPSPDKVLQARLFSYSDAQAYRLGINHNQLLINKPIGKPKLTYQRDGLMSMDDSVQDLPNYFPNSVNGPQESEIVSPVDHISGLLQKFHGLLEDDFDQCRELYQNVLKKEEKERLKDNIANSLSKVDESIQKRAIINFEAVDPSLANGINDGIKKIQLSMKQAKASKQECP